MTVINKDYSNIKVGTTDLQRLYAGNTLIWELESPTPTDYSTQYLTFVAKGGGNNRFYFKGSTWLNSGNTYKNLISYSTDSGATWSEPSNEVSFNVSSGDVVMWKGEMTSENLVLTGIGSFANTDTNFDVYGNIMSLIYGDNFIGQTDLSNMPYVFMYLFQTTDVVDASNLVLPATTLSNSCYGSMFISCPYLIKAPQLPAITMAYQCYQNMFRDCTALAQAPALPATTLETRCYQNMFQGCFALTTAPSLPATALTNSCYYYMFRSCSGLTSSPDLLATTLAPYCYSYMFANCTNLNYVKMLATDISANSCLTNWVQNVASSGTFVKDANTTIQIGDSGIPQHWTVQNE